MSSGSGTTPLPSTNSTTKKMMENAHQEVCHSLPNGWSLLGQKIHPGHVHMLCQMDMDSSRQIFQEARNMEFMWSFHAFNIYQICQDLST